MKAIALATFSSCLMLATLGLAADERTKEDKNAPVTDEQFVMKASEDGLAEVNHGMLAAQKAASPEVKQFGQRMVQDHGKANQELLDLANRKQFKVAKDMGEKHKAVQTKLSSLSGAEFDRQFMHHMVEAHEKAVTLFKTQAKDGKDEAVKAFATKTLPTLEDHLKMARSIHAKLEGGGK
jgi:putative membrane protein